MSQGSRSIARLRFRESRGELNILEVPGTDYELHLKGSLAVAPGTVLRGEIHASALRMHRSDAGGRFIEPVYGPPRIVQGTVLAVDRAANRVLLDLTVPAWITIHAGNAIDDFHEGELWNCYVESGTRFVQAR
jgi:hypothetical protein